MAKPSHKSSKRKPNDSLKPQKTTKTKRKPEDSVRSEAAPLQIEDDVPDFPRGGGSSLSRREEDEVRAEVDAEFEQEQLGLNKKGKKHKGTHLAEDDLGSLFGEGITGKLPKFANKITLKNVSAGMKLWGVISEVNEKDLVVSLPGGLRGLIRAREASDLIAENEVKDSDHNFLCSIFHVGQLVSCVVIQVDDDNTDRRGKRKIWLSLRLALLHKGLTLDSVQEGMVLTAYVKSNEDHGYILHFGPSSFSGFLPKKSKDGCEVKMHAGQLLQGVVRSIDKARRVIHLDSDSDVISKCVTKDVKGISIDLLVPGMMVNARIKSTLENGIMLSFLTYFTGTVDVFHLQNIFPSSKWKEEYSQNKKVNARILFIDPSTRAVGLTMNPHLLHNKAPASHVKVGEIFDRSRVVRVDRGMGLLLEIPSTPMSTPGYVNIFDVSEDIRKLEKKFKEGNHVRVRILGFKHLEGLATGTLKASAFEGSVFTHSDVKPGMVVKGKIISVESFGAIVQFFGGVKALCPLPHMSEFDIVKPRKKFKVGAELVFRVLGCKSKRITVTHKKTLLKSKLKILSSYAEATDGLVTHGWITKIEKHGCFVRFYNGVQGFAPRSELGLEPGVEPSSMYHVGQVVKCRVVSAVPSTRRINLSFVISPSRGSLEDTIKLGAVVSGVVERVTPNSVIVHVSASGYVKGTILTEHLADHQEQATAMKSLLKPGYEFDQLLVLDLDVNNVVLSAKYSLINSAAKLPVDVAHFHPQSVTHGYICNIIESGCFVRFLGRVTAFSPKHKATDDQRTDISEAFYVGQSVRSHILNVDSELGRVTVSLKQSSCFSTDASFVQTYFLLEEKIANLQLLDSEGSDYKWVEDFIVGSVVKGEVHEVKEYGVVLSFKEHSDVFGFISHYQLGGINVEVGSVVQARVLDIARTEHLVDLSVKPELISMSKTDKRDQKKKRKRDLPSNIEEHQTVNANIEIVKENYLVLSLPEFNHAVGYASLADYNTQKLPRRHFVNGQSVSATVGALPSPSTAGRLLLLLNSLSEVKESSSSKRAKKKSSYDVGSLVEAEITDIKPFEMLLKFGFGFRGRLHITEVHDDHNVEDPLKKFRVGQMLTARIVEKIDQAKKNKKYQWELSIKPSILSGSGEKEDALAKGENNFSSGESVGGYVVTVENEWVWFTISRHLNGQLFVLDSSCEPSELQDFQKRFTVGKPISGRIISFSKEKKLIRLTLLPSSVNANGTNIDNFKTDDLGRKVTIANAGEHHIHEGDILGGRITKILPGVSGLLVQIGPHLYGKVHYTELTSQWVTNPLAGYVEGQYVKCKIIEISRSVQGNMHFDLSLRDCTEGTQIQNSSGIQNNQEFSSTRFEKIEELQPHMIVQGYVKNVMSKGCFIMLSRKVDAKIRLSNLSASFIESPENEFPVGKLVKGKVLSVEPMSKRVEVTLKTEATGDALKSGRRDFSSLEVGEVISGRIKRIESFGLFITIEQSNMVGLCHISELSDSTADNIESKYRVGERVTAKVLKVDEERHRISLGMKESYMTNDSNGPKLLKQNSGESIEADSDTDDCDIPMLQAEDVPDAVDAENGSDTEHYSILSHVESRTAIPPLQVILDDMDDSDLISVGGNNQELLNGTPAVTEKNKKREKKKAKEERELEIRAAEQRLLEKDIPRTADEFEKLARTSPNSSFVWINYMAFMLSLADIEKARSIAERALRTINIREEAEKLNVWVAYFNLENEYGNPREEAVAKTFQRALQYCDPKKVHLALLGMYERTEQYKLVDELLDQMIKKFKHSCKVWLRRVQSFLKQEKDGIQSIVKRALICLPRNKHIKFISQTGILEFKCGVPDRGRSMFEEMLREYPKRTDLWSVYLDQEIRLGDVDLIRALFERATSLSLPPKKMKFLFKKYLEYEKANGDEERVAYVKKKALEYVESSHT